MTKANAIILKNVRKVYGTITAVDGISLSIEEGTVFGLLGPNGAGKTTLLKILTTLTTPTSGEAYVQGYDVRKDYIKIRGIIGVVPQENNLDRYLTARENLVLHAKMQGMRRAEYNEKIDDLLNMMGLFHRRNDFPDKFSGGMQRRLIVARALIHTPSVLFLDEPTTGLDPQSRRAVWDYIRSLKEKATIFLTTHYMEEADQLCDRIVIIDHGKSLIDGTSAAIKRTLKGSGSYEVEFESDFKPDPSQREFLYAVSSTVHEDNGFVRINLKDKELLKPLIERIEVKYIKGIRLLEPTLEDVFIHLTGRSIRD